MPSIPVYTAQRNITAKTSEPLRNEASKPFENQQKVFGALQNVTQAWSDSHDVMQATEAKAKYETSAAEIQTRAKADPDFKNSEKYTKELQEAKRDSLLDIDNQQVANKLGMDFDYNNNIAGIKIDAQFKAKQLEYNKVMVKNNLDAILQKKLSSTTEAERMMYDSEVSELIDSQLKSGTISQLEAEVFVKESLEEAAKFDSVVRPEEYLKNSAKHYGIDRAEYIKGKKTAQDSIKRGKAEMKESQRLDQVKNHTTLARALANGEVTRLDVPRITTMMRDGKVSQQFGEAYIRVLTSPRSIGRSKSMKRSGFIEFSKQLFDAETEEGKEKALIKIFNATADGEKLKDEEMAVLLRGADKASKEGKGFISGLKDFVRTGLSIEPGVIAYNYLKKITEGKDHKKAKEESIAEEQIRVTPERTQYSVGDMVDTPRGPMYVWGYYEDGEPDVRLEKPKK